MSSLNIWRWKCSRGSHSRQDVTSICLQQAICANLPGAVPDCGAGSVKTFQLQKGKHFVKLRIEKWIFGLLYTITRYNVKHPYHLSDVDGDNLDTVEE